MAPVAPCRARMKAPTWLTVMPMVSRLRVYYTSCISMTNKAPPSHSRWKRLLAHTKKSYDGAHHLGVLADASSKAQKAWRKLHDYQVAAMP